MRWVVVLTLMLTACQRPVYGPRAVQSDWNSEFLYWCVEEGEWPVDLKPPTDCSEVSRGQWDHLPIVVNATEELQKEVMEAVDVFNNSVGFELFKYDHANMEPDVAVIPDGDHFFAAALAKHWSDGAGRHHGLVKVFNGLEHKDRADIMVHELGHIVGLRHDKDNYMSIMYPSVASRVAYLEPIDIEALRFIYRQ